MVSIPDGPMDADTVTLRKMVGLLRTDSPAWAAVRLAIVIESREHSSEQARHAKASEPIALERFHHALSCQMSGDRTRGWVGLREPWQTALPGAVEAIDAFVRPLLGPEELAAWDALRDDPHVPHANTLTPAVPLNDPSRLERVRSAQ